MAYHRKEPRMSGVGAAVSVALHLAALAIIAIIAAREGVLGKRFRTIAVTIESKEAPKEQPRQKPAEQPPEPGPISPKAAAPTVVVAVRASSQPVPSPAVNSSVAPPPSVEPDFLFGEGKLVESGSDPKVLYKTFVEYALRSNWKRPAHSVDLNYVAEVEVGIDRLGRIVSREWKKASGNEAWDNSVRQALAQTRSLERTPPGGFPEKVLVRFDVQVETDALRP